MALMYLTYSISFIFTGVFTAGFLFSRNLLQTDSSPYRFIVYGSIIIAFVYFFVRSQTRRLIKTSKILNEKNHALSELEIQKNKIEIREKEMTDSLIYAQRIQEALFPSEIYFRKYFKDSFIFLKPKDIVSGDFYWIGEKGDKLFVVAADCTGHGVPGALMSIIGMQIINEAINVENIESPSGILAVLDKGLEKTFSREKNIGTIIRDGMDLGLCVIDRKKRKLEFAGAFFPLYLIRENKLLEVKGDKIIIGMNPECSTYNNHQIDLLENDICYLFSDGYADQFGGAEKKKFMYRRFRYLLLTIHGFPVEDQKSILEDNIKTWMGTNEQIDDIMVIGFRPII